MAQVKDPVCGMTIDSATAPARSTYQGQTYYFCGEDCKEQFDENPGQFVSRAASAGRPEPRPEL